MLRRLAGIIREGILMNPKNPIFIVSKGRFESRLTSRALEAMNVPYYIVVESQEFNDYAKVIDHKKILVLPDRYLDEYDTCDDLGDSISKGPGSARNFCWDYSIKLGADKHWALDDNMDYFFRLNKNTKIPVASGTIFRCAEDFVDRYENVSISGFNYDKFCKCRESYPPFYLNTRIYSCLLIKNSIPYRWRCRYNEDTDLCLRVLKDGFCTILFNAFLCGKLTTQTISGGNTKEFYEREGTYNKSKMLADLHPDAACVVKKFHRWHHHVDYSGFKKNILVRRSDAVVPKCVDNYDMELVSRE